MTTKLPPTTRALLPRIYEIVRGGCDDYDALYSSETKMVHDASCRAKIRSRHMLARASKLAANYPSVVKLFYSEQLEGIAIAAETAIIFKKMDRAHRSRNNDTPHIERYRAQEEIAEIPVPLKLIAGYIESDQTGEIAGIYLTLPCGRGVRWHLELQRELVIEKVEPLFVEEEQDTNEEIDLAPRRQLGDNVVPLRRSEEDADD